MVSLLKLGGSVITDKDRPETVDRASIERAARDISTFLSDGDERLILVHGGGSFGHHRASAHDITETRGSRDAAALVDVHRGMGELNDAVLAGLHEHGVQAIPVRPLSLCYRDEAGTLSMPSRHLAAMLEEIFVPVVHGDVVVHSGSGGTVLSGDEIVASVARSLDIERIGLCSTVPGVLDEDGTVIPAIDSVDTFADALGESDATDVTGGMARKVERMLALESPASVFGLDELDVFLETGTAGTVIR